MKSLFGLFVLSLLSSTAGAARWVQDADRPVSGSAELKLTLALPQRNLDRLEQLFWSVSNPDSPSYQEFLPKDEIAQLVASDPTLVHRVSSWLIDGGVNPENMTTHSDAISVKTTVDVARSLFRTDFSFFQSKNTGKRVIRASQPYYIDESIKDAIVFVSGLIDLPGEREDAARRLRRARGAFSDAPSSDVYIPEFVLALYGVPNTTVTPIPSPVSQGVGQWGEYYLESDCQTYDANNFIPNTPMKTNHVFGNVPSGPAGEESQMDVEMITSMNPQGDNWYFNDESGGWQYEFGVLLNSLPEIPLVISMSYGTDEQDSCSQGPNCTTTAQDYISRVNIEYMKVGLRGTSMIASSGDNGANGADNNGCTNTHFGAHYPAASPYVTSVGATQLNNTVYDIKNPPPAICYPGALYQCVSGGVEVAVSLDFASYTSGGGFSNFSVQPDYQKAAVAAYLNSGVTLPPSSYWNSKNRGFPDVAAVGTQGYIVENTYANNGGDGTSMSAPVFAGIASQLNSHQIKLTGKPLGFLNPLLYKMAADKPEAFTDVTSGDNIHPQGAEGLNCSGFVAAKGWDPVTGLGTPNFPNMVSYLSELANKRSRARVKRTRLVENFRHGQ